jgi:hypothetical protein
MKIILSRKGFDSSYGGCASPIFEDGSLVSLPIPLESAPIRYSDVRFNSGNCGNLVRDLTKGKLTSETRTHLDPDLRKESLSRRTGWLPAFGQSAAAQSHLASNSVGEGDLFLFFGWFKRVEEIAGHWRFVPNAPDLHVVFGWLQVGDVLSIGSDIGPAKKRYPWLKDHPHLYKEEANKSNTIYVAKKQLAFDFMPEFTSMPGGGVFEKVAPPRVLTKPGQHKRSYWQLPRWMLPQPGKPILTYHINTKQNRWFPVDDHIVELQSVAKGQEFVLPLIGSPLEKRWLKDIFGRIE